MDNVLLYFSLKYKGNWEKIYDALERKEKIDHSNFVDVTSNIDTNFVSIINPLYPQSLKNSHKPPFTLFVEGDLNLLSNYHQIIGITGGNVTDKYTNKIISNFLNDLNKENRIILVGDDEGIEREVLTQIIEQNQKIIFITKQGIKDFISENSDLVEKIRKNNYLIISEKYEFKLDEDKKELTYEYNSRLKSGIAKAYLFVQCFLNSECMKIVNYNLNDGKDIFVIPENIFSKYKGNNALLKQGAKLVENSYDILNEM